MTNTTMAPAAVFAGDGGGGGRIALIEPRVTRLTPTPTAETRGLSGSFELEGWVTASTVLAQNHSSSRSDRTQPAAVDDDASLYDDTFTVLTTMGAGQVVRKKPGGRRLVEANGYVLTHLALDASVLHLSNAADASNEVKFEAGAELSKAVN